MLFEFYNVLDENIPFQVHGTSYDEDACIFKRMDLEVAAMIANVDPKTYSFVNKEGKFINNVYSHAREAASGRIRFYTDSPQVAIRATLQNWNPEYAKSMVLAKYGFDVYVDTENGSTYAGTISTETIPETAGLVNVEGSISFNEEGPHNITIYFPISIETKEVQIGVVQGCTIQRHKQDYKEKEYVVYYGSSVTQGGAVSKPGNSYVNIVGRNLNVDYLNLGVWGSAKGQARFASYIAEIKKMTLFVLDYDHNNANIVNLTDTHYAFYETIRKSHPSIPIVILTRPNNRLNVLHEEDAERYSTVDEMKAVILETYEKAVQSGDKNVHYIDGKTFFEYSAKGLADNVHPNDYGQSKMAEGVTAVLKRIYAGEKNIKILDKEEMQL